MRLIDADKLNFSYLAPNHNEYSRGFYDGTLFSINIINEAPTIEAEPVRKGEWITRKQHFGKFVCSECGFMAGEIENLSFYNYCPNCGAKMEE